MRWCPSHVGIEGNEIADELAKLGLEQEPSPDAYTSIGHIRRVMKRKTITNWKAYWEDEEDRGEAAQGLGKQYRQISAGLLTFSLKPSVPNIPRHNQSAYIQLKTGIGYLKAYMKAIGKVEEDKCSCKKGKQNAAHLILYCRKYSVEREALRKTLSQYPLTLHILFSTKKGKEALSSFLTGTGICTRKWYTREEVKEVFAETG
jgi:hypothetical protein